MCGTPSKVRPRVQNPDSRNLWLAVALWSVVTFAGGLGAVLYAEANRQAEMETAWRRAETQAAAAEDSLLSGLEAVRSSLQLLLLRQRLIDYGDAPGAMALEAVLKDLAQEGRHGIVLLSVADLAGRMVWSSAPDVVGNDISGRSYFTELTDGSGRQFSASPPEMERAASGWRVHAARPIPAADGAPVAIAVVSLDPLLLSGTLGQQVSRPGHSIVIHRLSDGTVRAISWDAETLLGHRPQPQHPVILAAQLTDRGRIVIDMPGEEGRVVAAWRVAGTSGMVVSARFDLAEEMANDTRLTVMLSLAVVLLSCGTLVICLAWSRGRSLHRRLLQEARHDPLTGLHNRRSLEAQMAGRAGPYAALLFDLDHFKSVNDRHGHDMGDRVLRDVAQALQGAVRPEDLVCRWGGEEMLVVLSRCPPGDAAPRAEALRRVIASLYAGRGQPIEAITASIGVACAPLHGAALPALIRAADAALYRAKAEGRDRVAMAEA